MRCNNAGYSGGLEKGDCLNDFVGIRLVQIGCRFISQNDLGAIDDRTCDGDTLLFPFG